jgi:cyclophilin family peptidyl-prolyl cis-trans isomerase
MHRIIAIISFTVSNYMRGGFFDKWNLRPSVVKGIEDGGIYEAKRRRGIVYGRSQQRSDKLSFFGIYKRDDNNSSITKFGRVKSGMEVVDRMRKCDRVTECGFVIDLQ